MTFGHMPMKVTIICTINQCGFASILIFNQLMPLCDRYDFFSLMNTANIDCSPSDNFIILSSNIFGTQSVVHERKQTYPQINIPKLHTRVDKHIFMAIHQIYIYKCILYTMCGWHLLYVWAWENSANTNIEFHSPETRRKEQNREIQLILCINWWNFPWWKMKLNGQILLYFSPSVSQSANQSSVQFGKILDINTYIFTT